ncbi:MAG: putative OmpR family two-component response regulator [Ilumatobacteraceae bacterium]|nr:putative OmpR family two-component response regulator [Ilumatobacteraceae bacterium]MCU1389033.1 putative OmpR family two-component response regulator [Ilumatobacteraceae bacterium]
MNSLLLVEDDERISLPLVRLLEAEGFTVVHVAAGEAALAAVSAEVPDLVLLDLSLPDIDGLDVCRRLRISHPGLPIVMLTARNEEVDMVVGLDAGADDYITKPFRVAELTARIRTRLRASSVANPANEEDQFGTLRVDRAARRAWIGEDELALAPKEFDLLILLSTHHGETLRREHIMTEVWDENWWGSTRTLDTHVASLRRKLGDTSDTPERIITVRGIGFRYEVG